MYRIFGILLCTIISSVFLGSLCHAETKRETLDLPQLVSLGSFNQKSLRVFNHGMIDTGGIYKIFPKKISIENKDNRVFEVLSDQLGGKISSHDFHDIINDGEIHIRFAKISNSYGGSKVIVQHFRVKDRSYKQRTLTNVGRGSPSTVISKNLDYVFYPFDLKKTYEVADIGSGKRHKASIPYDYDNKGYRRYIRKGDTSLSPKMKADTVYEVLTNSGGLPGIVYTHNIPTGTRYFIEPPAYIQNIIDFREASGDFFLFRDVDNDIWIVDLKREASYRLDPEQFGREFTPKNNYTWGKYRYIPEIVGISGDFVVIHLIPQEKGSYVFLIALNVRTEKSYLLHTERYSVALSNVSISGSKQVSFFRENDELCNYKSSKDCYEALSISIEDVARAYPGVGYNTANVPSSNFFKLDKIRIDINGYESFVNSTNYQINNK